VENTGISHAGIGSTVECTKEQLVGLKHMCESDSFRLFIKILEDVKENGVMNTLLAYKSTENEIRIAQGAAEMIGTIADFNEFNNNALEQLSQIQEDSQN